MTKLVLTEPTSVPPFGGIFFCSAIGWRLYLSSMQMYFVALVLPTALNEKIVKYKMLMLEKYNCRVALKSPAHMTLVFSVTALFASANNGVEGASDINKKTDIAGGVIHTDTRKPMTNVSVTAYSANKKEKVVYTDSNGNYSFSELKAGTYKLVFEKNGYKKVIREKVTIRPDEGCLLNVEMDDENEFQIVPGNIF